MHINPQYLYLIFALLIAAASAAVAWRSHQDFERGEGGILSLGTSRTIFPDGPLLALIMAVGPVLFSVYWRTLTGVSATIDVFGSLFLLGLFTFLVTAATTFVVGHLTSRKKVAA